MAFAVTYLSAVLSLSIGYQPQHALFHPIERSVRSGAACVYMRRRMPLSNNHWLTFHFSKNSDANKALKKSGERATFVHWNSSSKK
jgi:hypothetical protein